MISIYRNYFNSYYIIRVYGFTSRRTTWWQWNSDNIAYSFYILILFRPTPIFQYTWSKLKYVFFFTALVSTAREFVKMKLTKNRLKNYPIHLVYTLIRYLTRFVNFSDFFFFCAPLNNGPSRYFTKRYLLVPYLKLLFTHIHTLILKKKSIFIHNFVKLCSWTWKYITTVIDWSFFKFQWILR